MAGKFGRNRYRAMLALKYTDEFIKADCKPLHEILGYAKALDLPKDAALKWVISANIHRRHLTPEQKREALIRLVAAQPEKSDRELAKQAKVSHPTIAKARRKAEATGKALPVDKRLGKDGKARKQPSTKVKSTDFVAKSGGDKRKDRGGGAGRYQSPLKPQDNSDEGDDGRQPVASPEVIARNLRDWISRHHAGAEAARKVIKASHLEDGVRREIGLLIERLISKWKTVLSTLEPKEGRR